jgi:hypothetical protein
MFRLLGLVLVGGCARGGQATVDGPPPEPVDSAPPIDASGNACSTGATCQTSTNLGSVSGDTGAQMQMASGYQSAWFRVRVTEDDHGVAGVKLKLAVRLTSPANANYDAFAYVDTGSDTIECTTPSGTTTTNGATDQVNLKWGEGTIANGSDDSRTVSIEVRPISGDCSASDPWQLVLVGDT